MRVEILPDDIWMTVCTGLDLCDHLQLAPTCPALWRWYRTWWVWPPIFVHRCGGDCSSLLTT